MVKLSMLVGKKLLNWVKVTLDADSLISHNTCGNHKTTASVMDNFTYFTLGHTYLLISSRGQARCAERGIQSVERDLNFAGSSQNVTVPRYEQNWLKTDL